MEEETERSRDGETKCAEGAFHFVSSSLRLFVSSATTLRAALGRGAEVVAALRAEPGAVAAARADRGAEIQRGEDREQQDEEPVRDGNRPHAEVLIWIVNEVGAEAGR